MTIALGALCVLAALASLLATMTAGALHRSDPAGNGLAAAQLVVILAITWLLTAAAVVIVMLRTPADPADLPWSAIGFGTVVGLGSSLAGHFVSLPYLIDGRNRGVWRTLVCSSLFTVPAAFLLHASWRGIGLPLPMVLALWGCGAVVVLGSATPWLARAAANRQRARTAATQSLFHITYPALLVRPRLGVDVVRGADDVRALPRERFAAPAPLLIDATGTTWTLQPTTGGEGFLVGRGSAPLAPAAVLALLLAIERLHPDPAEDARIRHLLALQRDVTALSFVLPR